ncbi:MT-A70 family [Stachybotrys elegans]|uniref:MT-A70 family n=1 Tax=Stachybotrys elegans TaxID=80388 RepID=A0A8K0SW43_9HYPO|nr:MT-A70 family [Stachybotrys elegans]
MDGPSKQQHSLLPSSVLFQNQDKTIVVLDIPRTLEEAQSYTAGGQLEPLERRIYSVEPFSSPFVTPEPKDGSSAHWGQSPASQIADLMTSAAVQSALQQLSSQYHGPYCHARLTAPEPPATTSGSFIPKDSHFLHGSIQDMRQEFVDTAPKFDIIVLDPPWPNRSARRSKKYTTAVNKTEMLDLLSLIPVSSHLATDGLVAIWVTNASSVLDLMTSPTGILSSWGLELVTEWTWVKVTAAGEPLYPVDSQWRKPWEKLLVAKRKGSRPPSSLRPTTIIAVPDLHSRKPNLRGLFQDVLGRDLTGLEVFARNLTAGWWSWGDEVLHFQDDQHWLTPA